MQATRLFAKGRPPQKCISYTMVPSRCWWPTDKRWWPRWPTAVILARRACGRLALGVLSACARRRTATCSRCPRPRSCGSWTVIPSSRITWPLYWSTGPTGWPTSINAWPPETLNCERQMTRNVIDVGPTTILKNCNVWSGLPILII